MRQLVYIETSIVSYLTAKPSRDLIQLAHQQITREWWEQHRPSFDLCISQLVLDEASKGDSRAAEMRLLALRHISIVPVTDDAIRLAEQMLADSVFPKQAAADALHLSIAACHKAHILLTWNCRHLANALIMDRLRSFADTMGFEAPILCTPEELMI